MGRVNDIENAKIRYDYSLIPILMSKYNYVYIDEDNSASIFGKSIHYAMTGSYTDINQERDIKKPTIVRHVSQIGYFCRVGNSKGKKFVEIWKPELVLHKVIDWSSFEWGITIPVSLKKNIEKVIGGNVSRGKSIEITLMLEGKPYKAKLANVDRDVKNDTYQIRYDSNYRLKEILRKHFHTAYLYIQDEREKKKREGQKRPQVVALNSNYIELLTTDKPPVFTLRLVSEDFFEADRLPPNDEQIAKAIIAQRSVGLTDEENSNLRKERLSNFQFHENTKKTITTEKNISNPILKEDIKQLYHYSCQICSTQIKKKGWSSSLSLREEIVYLTADAHHILALKDGGPDIPSNILCVCPNCHKRLHTGEYEIVFASKKPICKNTITGEEKKITLNEIHKLSQSNSG